MSVTVPANADAATSTRGEFRPYVADSASVPELTWSAVLLGSLLGVVFGASSLYLVLRVGMTVSASIPVAVLSITVFRAFSRAFGTRPATILENNIVQTAGSAGESIAFGVGVTMPALMYLGYDMEEPLFRVAGVPVTRVALVAVLGGLLGVLMMIPLRRAFIVKQHGTLTYPEGTACAQVLIVGERGGSSASTVFAGFGLAALYQVMMKAFKLWTEVPEKALSGFKGAVVSLEASPVLLGVGYIIGFRISCVMVGGGLLAALVLTPAIALFGGGGAQPIFPGTKPIAQMTPKEIKSAYILYIGAGAVAAGGIISLLQALPLIGSSLMGGLRDLGRSDRLDGRGRTERDLPIWVVGLGTLGLVAAIAATSLMPTDLPGRFVGAVMIVGFGFLFVTVSSRLTGEIGSSSNPISGMTVATLLLTCLIFVLLGWVGPGYRLAALSIAGIVCIAASNGGTTSQDLKTGYLVGATPRAQQVAILVGALTSAVVIGQTLLYLNAQSTVITGKAEYLPTARAEVSKLTETQTHEGKTYHVWRVVEPVPGAEAGKYLVDDAGRAAFLVDPAINGRVGVRDDGKAVTKYDAPKATLMALIIDGVMKGNLPRALLFLGVMIAVVLHLAGAPALAFAVGVYLPLSTSMPIFAGGLVRAAVDRLRRSSPGDSDSSPAVLLSSGFIAGGAILGMTLDAVGQADFMSRLDVSKRLPAGWNAHEAPSLVAFGLTALVLFLVGAGALFRDGDNEPAAAQGVSIREDEI